jgi:hypothetical protein
MGNPNKKLKLLFSTNPGNLGKPNKKSAKSVQKVGENRTN